MWNNSYTTPTERWQKTSDFSKGKKLPTYLDRAKEKRKTTDKSIGTGPAPVGGSCEGGKVSTHYEAPSLAETGGGGGRSFGATEDSAATGVQRAKRRDSRTEDQCQPSLSSPRGLSAPPPGRAGLGAEALASEVRSQGEDWGWLHEHSLKGPRAPQLDGRESGKRSGTAEEARDHCSGVCEERGSEHCLNELWRSA